MDKNNYESLMTFQKNISFCTKWRNPVFTCFR